MNEEIRKHSTGFKERYKQFAFTSVTLRIFKTILHAQNEHIAEISVKKYL